MEQAAVAELQVLLEGTPLPNERSSLVRYALQQGASGAQVAMLRGLPEQRFGTIDEVAECLLSVQPPHADEKPPSPREESGEPPGGDAYTQAGTESGRVRDLDSVTDG
jgi:hypothetical protein